MYDHKTIINFAKHFATRVDDFESKTGGHNNLYIVEGSNHFALRVTPVSHRNMDEVKSEIDFMLYLKSNGVALAKPTRGLDGQYCYQTIVDDEEIILSAFEVAIGEDFWGRTEHPERLFAIGQTLGQMHRLSKDYMPVGVQPRRQWNENPHFKKAESIFSRYDKRLSDVFAKYMQRMAGLSKDRDSFGLIHGDYLLVNYFFNQNEITVFDFDECEYAWFVSDIAACMLHYLIGGTPALIASRAKDAEEWFSLIMQGYLTENELAIEQIKNIDLFFKMREYNLLSYNLERQSEGFNEWQQALVDGILERIRSEHPFVDIDFVSLYEQLIAKV